MKQLLIAILFLVPTMAAFAQREQIGENVTFHDTTWYDRGFDFYIGGGMFFGGKKSALYYNGSSHNECNLNYLFDNEYRRREIKEAIINIYSIGMDVEVGFREEDLNWDPQYNLSACVSLGVRYKIRDNWGVSLSYTFSRLTVINKLLLAISPSLPSNTKRMPELTLSGKEDRSMIDLSVSYLFSGAHRIVKPFLEVGAQFNYARVKKFDAVLLDEHNNPQLTLTLLDPYGGAGYVPGVDMQTYDEIYGGGGFGFSFATGLKLVVNKYVSLDPTFYGCMSRLNLPVYDLKSKSVVENPFTFNYGVMLRVVMNDFFFHNR